MNEDTNFDNNKKITQNLVRHVHISNEEAMENCISYFPNATDLTLLNISSTRSNWLLDTLKDMIPLKNLTILNIRPNPYFQYSFEKLIELLSLTSNLITLEINRVVVDQNDFRAIENSENFQLVSKVNKIRNVILNETYNINGVELLSSLCPQLQHFTIRHSKKPASIVRLLTSKNNINTRHLILLSIEVHDEKYLNKLKKLIEEGKLLYGFHLKVQHHLVDFWR